MYFIRYAAIKVIKKKNKIDKSIVQISKMFKKNRASTIDYQKSNLVLHSVKID